MRVETPEASRFAWLEHVGLSFRYALRQLRKSPGFTAVVVATLGLGIGANSAVFSALDTVLLRPLPFPEGDRLVRIHQRNPKTPITIASPARLADWDRLNETFQAMTGFYTEDASETTGEFPEKLTRAFVAPRFLEVWGMAPALGRDFTPEEGQPGGPNAVLISDRFWRRKFGADPNVIGRQLRFGTSSATVVGVMPASFLFLVRDVDAWSPIILTPNMASFIRDATWLMAVGRLKRGVSVAQATANLSTIQTQLGREYPKSDASLTVDVEPLAEDVVGPIGSSLWLVFGSATLLLLIACVNVAALLLVRTTEREHEIAVRASLGASRKIVIVQLMVETAVLSLAGAAVGLLIAGVAARAFHASASNLPRVDEIRIDWRIVAYSLGTAVAVTLLCGLLPAVRTTRRDLSSGLAHGGRSQVSGRQRVQWLLVATQVSLAVVLLSGAGLLLRSFQELGRVAPGFEPSHILTFHVSGSYGETANYPQLLERIDRTLDFLRAVPGVQQAATAASLPGVPGEFLAEVRLVEGRAESEPKVVADSRYVSTGYFATMQMPLLAGEPCETRGSASLRNRTALVNRSFVNTYFAGESPIGHHLATAVGGPNAAAIVGIVADAREQGLHRAPGPTVYWCFSAPGPSPFYLVRTASEPSAFTDTVRRKVKEIEPARAVFDITPLNEHLSAAYSENRLRMLALASFAGTAVLLACVGLYGTLSYLVNIRRREVGLRLALGAARGQIVRRFFGQGVGVSLAACMAGLGLSVVLNRVLAEMLYGVSPSDPATLSAVALIVLAAAGLASLVPSIRAALVEPMMVLRDE
jgi:putative ABC transport system permease protein